MADSYFLIGLGNPGPRYEHTRHNLGFDLADRLADAGRARWSRPHETYERAAVRLQGHDLILVKPMTWMNLSGEAVEQLRSVEPVSLSHLMVASDDIALPLGQIRLRRTGSDGGHNGLASVIEYLETQRFARLRLGVGPVPEGVDPSDFVTDPFPPGDDEAVSAMLRGAARCVSTWLAHGLNTAMNRFNRVPKPPNPVDDDQSGQKQD